MVEFAIVLPLLMTIVMGVLDFGRVLNYWDDENQMAANGARYAAVNSVPAQADCSGSTLQALIACEATSELRNGSGSVTSPVAVKIFTSGNVGDPVKVCIKASYTFVKILGFGPTLTLRGDATMRLEQVPTNYVPDGTHGTVDCASAFP